MSLVKGVLGVTLILIVAAALGALPWGTNGSPASPPSAIGPTSTSTAAVMPRAATGAATVPPAVISTLGTEGPAVTAGAIAPHTVALSLPGPRPRAWGALDLPPGMPSLGSTGPAAPSTGGDPPSPCFVVNPSVGGQSMLPSSCVGHDEPTIGFYSASPGSGGNVTWNGSLPMDQSTTQNQSNLYATAFFGLVVSDPASWLGQCYVEVQLYPDFSWTQPDTSTSGVWSSAVVGWQVDPVTGAIDTCFYEPLSLNGVSADGYFELTQGDRFSFSASGWMTDPTGETIALTDLTSGAGTKATLYNSTGGIPLDPAYGTNSVAGALLWSAGGQLPISFGFEIGRAGNPAGVANNTYGGCSPGPNPSSPGDAAVPCPSYDPVSWVNDTLTPWSLSLPTFFNGAGRSSAVQVDLTSSLGGNRVITNESGGSCANRVDSAFCTYPWFGYSCTLAAYTFGATDYASESNDFGEGAQFSSSSTLNLLGLATFLPDASSQPNCGAANYTVGLSTQGVAGGSVQFLSTNYSSSGSASGVSVGDYSLTATAPTGVGFAGWSVSGGLSIVGPSSSPAATLHVGGSGSVSAKFTNTPALTTVSFDSATLGTSVIIAPGAEFGNTTGFTTIASGHSIDLAPGVYGIQAGPAPGSAFESWGVTSGAAAAEVAARGGSVTWLTVTGAGAAATVTATYTSTANGVTVTVTGNGNGTVDLGGQSFPYNPSTGESQGVVALEAGTYVANATPAPGWEFLGWSYSPSTVLMDFNASTNVSFPAGVATLSATFAAAVTVLVSPASGGSVAVGVGGPLANNTTVWLPRGYYALNAVPLGFFKFSAWQVSDPAALWVLKSSYPITHVWVNASATVTGFFQSVTNVSLTFHNVPAAGGSIRFNYGLVSGATATNTTLGNGTFLVVAEPAVGYAFSHWTVTTPPLVLTAGILTVSGGGGSLTATFTALGYPITFVGGAGPSAATAVLNGQTIASGQSVMVPGGRYPLSINLAPATSFLKWVSTGKVFLQSHTLGTTTATVEGAGTLSAVIDPFAVTSITASSPVGDVGVPVTFTAHVIGTAPQSYAWHGLPTGCSGSDANSTACTPSATGTFETYVSVTGTNGLPLKSSSLAFTVGPRPLVTGFTASRYVLDVNMSTNLSVTTSGGSLPLSYSYAGLPAGCSNANTSSIVCTPTGPESSTVEVTVTDMAEVSVTANLTLTVNPPLSVSGLTTSRAVVTVGISFVLAASVTGGGASLAYRYSGLPSSCPSANVASLRCTPGSGGTYSITVNVTDAAGAFGLSSVSVLVNPIPTVVSFVVTPSTIQLGQNLTFSVNATGGTGPLTYNYSTLPAGCVSQNASNFTCRPTATGTFQVGVVVTDVFGVSTVLTPYGVVVNPVPAAGSGSSGGVPWWVWAGVAVVVVVGAAGVYLLLRRRSAKE